VYLCACIMINSTPHTPPTHPGPQAKFQAQLSQDQGKADVAAAMPDSERVCVCCACVCVCVCRMCVCMCVEMGVSFTHMLAYIPLMALLLSPVCRSWMRCRPPPQSSGLPSDASPEVAMHAWRNDACLLID
jgi:hypothetical protein